MNKARFVTARSASLAGDAVPETACPAKVSAQRAAKTARLDRWCRFMPDPATSVPAEIPS